MGTVLGTIKKKGEGQFTLLSNGAEHTYTLSARVAPFVSSIKEGDNVEYDVKNNEISFIKKVYQAYTPKPPAINRPVPAKAPAPKVDVPPAVVKPAETPVVAPKVEEKPVWKTTEPLHPAATPAQTSTPKEVIADINEKVSKGLSNEEVITVTKAADVVPATPNKRGPGPWEESFKSVLGEKDIRISGMASMKVAMDSVKLGLEESEGKIMKGKGEISLSDLNTAISDEVIRLMNIYEDALDDLVKRKRQ